MSVNRLKQSTYAILLLSFVFMLVSLGLFLRKEYLLNRVYEGDYTLTGNITEIGKRPDDNYIMVKFSNNQKDTIEKLIYDYDSKMVIPPDTKQKSFDSTGFMIDDLVLVNFNNKSKIISNIVYLGKSSPILLKVMGKILDKTQESIKIRTIEQIPEELTFSLNGSEGIFNKTTTTNQKISLDKLKINDDVEIDYSSLNDDRIVQDIYLTKIGPNNQ